MALGAGRETAGRSALELIAAWDGKAVVSEHDAQTGAWFFIAVHDDTLGTPVGGCRMKVYDRPEDGLLDAMRLAEGMTAKWASIGIGFGGGKSVLALDRPIDGEAREGLLRRFGALLNTLKGAYGTGEDLGTTPSDMALLASVSDHVVGLSADSNDPTDPGPFTALGVFSAMRAALNHRFGSDSMDGRSMLIQGVGDVGAPLARLVAGSGGRLLLADLDEVRARSMAEELQGDFVPADEVYTTDCDIYAPCAIGATVNDRTIPGLGCAIVAGSANNQLETDADASRLVERGILYAPDYVTNAGGAMAFGLMYKGVTDPNELESRVVGLNRTLAEIFSEADNLGASPLVAAERRVARVLEGARRA
jgi:leucine dehydrogenase